MEKECLRRRCGGERIYMREMDDGVEIKVCMGFKVGLASFCESDFNLLFVREQ